MKRCTKCGVEKKEGEFYSDKRTRDNLQVWCKDCKTEDMRTNEKFRKRHIAIPQPKNVVPRMEKICPGCGEEKPHDSFGVNTRSADGLQYQCKACRARYSREKIRRDPELYRERQRQWRKRRRFHAALLASKSDSIRCGHTACTATEEELGAIFTGKCFICSVPEMELTKKLCLDHDHLTGRARGFLCGKCNKMLGLAGDSQEILIDAVHYLMSHQHQEQ